MNRLILLCLLLAGTALGIRAQTLTVTDSATGLPLEMATLSSSDPKTFAVTDAQGRADVRAFRDAAAITLRMLGYGMRSVSFAELEQANFRLSLSQEGLAIGQAVVTATRWARPARDIPGHYLSITPREAQLMQPQTSADLLGASGEVFIQKSQQGGGSPMIRGFATNRLLIAVDGVRMNTAIFRSGNVQNVINIDPLSVERTEVLFGPGSVMYGSDAIGGVMAFQTITPALSITEKPAVGGSSSFRYSSANNELTGHADVSVGWKRWAIATSITHSNFGDLRMGRHGPDDYLSRHYVVRQDSADRVVTNSDPLVQRPTGYAQTNVMQKVRFRPNAKWDVQYGFHYSETSSYSRYDRHLRTRNGLPRSAEWDYGPQVWMMNNLSIVHASPNAVYDRLALRVAHQLFEESRMDRNLNNATRRVREEQVHAYSANLDLAKMLGERHELLYGLEALYNDVRSTGTDQNIRTGVDADGPARYPMSDWASLGAYLTYRFRASELLTVQAGARYNQFMLNARFDTTFYPFPFTDASLNNGALTGNLGLMLTPTERWAISLNLATGFRSPNVDDLGKVFDSEPGAVIVPNPNLQAEYAYNAELGIAKVVGKWLKLDVTSYLTYLDNALVRRDFTLGGQDSIVYDGQLSRVQAVQNAAFAFVYGIQTGMEVKLPKGFGLMGRFNWQRGVEETDDGSTAPLRHAGPWFASAHLNYRYQKLMLNLYGIFNGAVPFDALAPEEQSKPELYAKDDNGDPWSPSWYTLNFKAMYQFHPHFSVSAGVENITDQRYRPYSSGLAAAGRNFTIALRASF